MGFVPFRAFSLCSVVASLDARGPPDICLMSPAPNRYPLSRPTSAKLHGHPDLAAWEAKRHSDAGPDVSRAASRALPIPTAPHGAALPGPDTIRDIAGQGCQSSNDIKVVFRASRTAKSQRSRPGFRPGSRAGALLGFVLFRAHSPPRVAWSFSTTLPLSGFSDQTVSWDFSRLRPTRLPLRVSSSRCLGARAVARAPALLRFLTFSSRLAVRPHQSLLAAGGGSLYP